MKRDYYIEGFTNETTYTLKKAHYIKDFMKEVADAQ